MYHDSSLLRRLHHTTELSEAPRPRPEIPAVRLGAEPWLQQTPSGNGDSVGTLGFFGNWK